MEEIIEESLQHFTPVQRVGRISSVQATPKPQTPEPLESDESFQSAQEDEEQSEEEAPLSQDRDKTTETESSSDEEDTDSSDNEEESSSNESSEKESEDNRPASDNQTTEQEISTAVTDPSEEPRPQTEEELGELFSPTVGHRTLVNTPVSKPFDLLSFGQPEGDLKNIPSTDLFVYSAVASTSASLGSIFGSSSSKQPNNPKGPQPIDVDQDDHKPPKKGKGSKKDKEPGDPSEPPSDNEDSGEMSEGELKINIPTPFNGDRTALRSFIQDCGLYLGVNKKKYDNDAKKIGFVLSFMKGGDAGLWKEQYISEHTNATTGIFDVPTAETYQAFISSIKEAFTEENTATTALTKLRKLQQGKDSVEEHNVDFKLLCGQAGIKLKDLDTDTLTLDTYQRTLHPQVLSKVLGLEKVPTTLSAFMSKAALLDNNYRNAMAIIKGNAVPKSNSGSSGRNFRSYNPKPRDPNAMDIDALTTAERSDYMAKGLCFHCAKRGHRISECPNKDQKKGNPTFVRRPPMASGSNKPTTYSGSNTKDPKGTARQINALLGQFSEEERNKVFDEFEIISNGQETKSDFTKGDL